jgi:hypothetical protein
MAPRLDDEIDFFEDDMPGCVYAHSFQGDSDTLRLVGVSGCNRRSKRRAGLVSLSLLGSPQGFKQAESHVAMGRVLPREKCDFLPQGGQFKDPIDEQQHTANLTSPRKVVEQQPGGKPKSYKRLHPFDGNYRPLQPQTRTCPFTEEIVMRTPYGPFCSVGTYRNQAQERIKVEAAECPRMAANAEVPLRDKRLGNER